MMISRIRMVLLGSGAVLLLTDCGPRRAAEWERPLPQQLTRDARFDGEPTLSPDGKRIVFTSFGEADLDLYEISLARPEERRLILAGPGDDHDPAFSPDGSRIAFYREAGPESDIMVVESAGGEPRRLTVEPGRDRQPAWSPEGDRLAFISDRTGRTEVWVMTLSTGQAVPISATAPPSADYLLQDPAWRGDDVLVSARIGFDVDLYALPAAGGPWRRLTSGPARERHPNPAANGRLAYTSDTTGYANLYVREPDGRVTVITDQRTDIEKSCWMEEGDRLLYGRRSPWALLGRSLAGGPIDTIQAPWGRNLHPSWSPDATELAFHSDLDGQDDIWRVGVADGGAGPVTASRADDSDPDWSATANRIVFTSYRSGNSDIWIMDPSGVEYLNLTNDPATDREARWSPDGTMVVFVSDRLGGRDDLWRVPAAGGEPTRLTDDAAHDAWPCLLADNRTIVFESDREGARALWSVPLEGGLARRLTTPTGSGSWDGRPAPMPDDASALVFTRWTGGNAGIYRLSMAGGTVVPIADEAGSMEDHPSVNKDGSQVAWQSGGNVDLWIIDARPSPPAPDRGGR